MDTESNVTYITLDGHVELSKYRYVYFVIVFTAYIVVICSNSTIVCLIVIHKNLHEPMYIFIAALLTNSVLYSTNIYPKLLVDFLSERQVTSYSACLLQFFIIYFLVCSEFLLLAAMSYDRYVSICKPLQYPTIMTKTRVSVLLVLSWFASACQISVLVILSAQSKLCNFTINTISCNNAIYGLQCVKSTVLTIYGLVSFINSSVLPVLFIIYMYTKILIIVYRSSREVRKKAAETCLPHLIVLIVFFTLCINDITAARVESSLSKTVRLAMNLQNLLYHPLFNPLIYGLKMKEISKHLRRLFCPTKIT
ncbi:hypothetical protein Q5P01_014175 [Channa striata]|uniref:Olfactory receptor n=1 Tax=Channa striata TaxID=64152 RepID=A0AA88SPA7_CHASR|nr:hypothetical protein Q5P01_014175 [Channa striata]